jgi:hypothetical protein
MASQGLQIVLMRGGVALGGIRQETGMQPILFHHRLEIIVRLWWYRFKVLLGQNVNVDKNFFASDAALKLSRGVLPSGTRITCEGRSDGVGMQALARMSGMNFAKAFGATYVDTPFKYIDHAPGEMSTWLAQWESVFNFDRGEQRITPGKDKVVDYSDYLSGKSRLNPGDVLRFQQFYWLHRHYPDSFKAVAQSLQQKYDFVPHTRRDDRVNIAIHIRRGDVGSNVNSLRFTPNEKIIRTIRDLCQIFEEMNLAVSVDLFSQGKTTEFAEFGELGCRLHLDVDAVWTMRRLIETDLLVMSKSSFSYVAALINRGVKIYEPTFNPPLSDWIVKRKDGSFDQNLVKRHLKDYLGAKAAARTPDLVANTG